MQVTTGLYLIYHSTSDLLQSINMYIVLTALVIFLNIFMVSVSCADTLSRNQPLTGSAINKEINIVYFHDFPYKKSVNQHVNGCFFTHRSLPTADFSSVTVLRCREQAHLLLPTTTIDHLEKEQARNGYIKFNLSALGIHGAKAIITAITPISPVILKRRLLQKNTDMVTSVFIRHSTDVRQYQFINEKTKNISTINVTGNHRFYVENRRTFIAVKNILPEDRMISTTGDTIRILCSTHKANGCYHPYHPGQPVQVYNLEAGHRHTYFVSNTGVLVHNDCKRINITEHYDNEKKIKKYEGQVNAITREYDGYGELFDEEGWLIYQGYFMQGKYHGHGTLYHTKSRRIKFYGYFACGKRHGRGTQFSDLASDQYVLYQGNFFLDQRSGRGIERFPKGGEKYNGEWLKDGRSGQGTEYHMENGLKRYEGSWSNNVPHGHGILYFLNETIRFNGPWNQGKYKDHSRVVRRFWSQT